MASGFSVKVVSKDRGWKGIVNTAFSINGATVKAGLVGEKAQRIHKDSSLSNAEIGTIHEFGAPGANIPERSFIRSTFSANQRKYAALAEKLGMAVFQNRGTIRGALEILGATMESDIKATIRAGIPPPLAQATIDRRSLRKKDREIPLIDTREFINSISHTVTVPNERLAKSSSGLTEWSGNAAMRVSGLERWSDSFSAPSFSSPLQDWSDSIPSPR